MSVDKITLNFCAPINQAQFGKVTLKINTKKVGTVKKIK